MLTTPVELIAIARVSATNNQVPAATYDFSSGFEAGTPEGATAGAAAILVNAAGDMTLFLESPCDPGSSTKQGGIKAVAHLVGVTTPAVVGFCTCTYGQALGGAYAAVDPEKAVRVRAYDANGDLLGVSYQFDVVVYRNPVTII